MKWQECFELQLPGRLPLVYRDPILVFVDEVTIRPTQWIDLHFSLIKGELGKELGIQLSLLQRKFHPQNSVLCPFEAVSSKEYFAMPKMIESLELLIGERNVGNIFLLKLYQ